MSAAHGQPGGGLEISSPAEPRVGEVLTREALDFVEKLEREFGERRREVLACRAEVQASIDGGVTLGFPGETGAVREGEWRIGAIPADLDDRRVEITGPAERKMMINALNSGARVFMADFEDALSPTWSNLIQGQLNVREAVRRTIAFDAPDGKRYRLHERTAVLVVRPRGWHLGERHVRLDGRPISPRCSTSGFPCSTTRASCSSGARVRTSTCPSFRRGGRRVCGTTSSSWRRGSWGCRAGRSRRRC